MNVYPNPERHAGSASPKQSSERLERAGIVWCERLSEFAVTAPGWAGRDKVTFVLGTFAHLLINQLTFECGYSTAALRERLYISEAAEAPMAGVLIYTAAGDAEGTMGGLVRMGKPGYLEPAILAALRSALWCSADPVCMEIGTQSGQGPDSCNLAASTTAASSPKPPARSSTAFSIAPLLSVYWRTARWASFTAWLLRLAWQLREHVSTRVYREEPVVIRFGNWITSTNR